MAIKHNIIIDQGSNYENNLTLSIEDGPADYSDFEIAASIKKYPDSTESFEMGAEITDPEGLGIALVMTTEQTTAIEGGKYMYDVIVYSDETTIKLLEGMVTVRPMITARPD